MRYVAPFPRLQSKQSVFRFSSIVSPPFDHAKSWSISSTNPGIVAGDRPHATQQKRSRFSTKNLRASEGSRFVILVPLLFFISTSYLRRSYCSLSTEATNSSSAFLQPPKRSL